MKYSSGILSLIALPVFGATYECVLPSGLENFNMVINGDVTSGAHTYTGDFAVEGTFTDIYSNGEEAIDGYNWWVGACTDCNFNLNAGTNMKYGSCNNCDFNVNAEATVGTTNSAIQDAGIDWGHLEWLANHLEAWESRPEVTDSNDRQNCQDCHKISILNETSSEASPLCLEPYMVSRSDNDSGRSMIVVREDGPSEIWLDLTCNTKPGPVILAPWANVYLKSNAGYQDGAVYAKNFEARSSSLQLHGDHFVGSGYTCMEDTSEPPPTAGPTSAPTSGPTSGPTTTPIDEQEIVPTGPTPTPPVGSNGDPHFKTWVGEHFEYHGQCDMVLLKDLGFADGKGIEIQIRTKLVRYWSYIQSVAIRIGSDILEIEGSDDPSKEFKYWYNFEYQAKVNNFGGFPVHFQDRTKFSSYKAGLNIDLSPMYPGEKIVVAAWKEFIRVDVKNGSKAAFGKSVGMLGEFGTGKTLSRDGSLMNDFMEYGQEWQVQPTEPMLFRKTARPQFPAKCIEPEDPQGQRRRRLAESSIKMEEAEAACARLENPLDRKDCVYDIIATQDLDIAGAY